MGCEEEIPGQARGESVAAGGGRGNQYGTPGVAAAGTERSGGLQEYFAGRTLVNWSEAGSRRQGDVDSTSRFKA